MRLNITHSFIDGTSCLVVTDEYGNIADNVTELSIAVDNNNITATATIVFSNVDFGVMIPQRNAHFFDNSMSCNIPHIPIRRKRRRKNVRPADSRPASD